jgi:hypothetical protein
MIIIDTISPKLAGELCRTITADLPEYSGLPEANEHYAVGVRSRMNFAAKIAEEYIGLIAIDFPYSHVRNKLHRIIFLLRQVNSSRYTSSFHQVLLLQLCR